MDGGFLCQLPGALPALDGSHMDFVMGRTSPWMVKLPLGCELIPGMGDAHRVRAWLLAGR